MRSIVGSSLKFRLLVVAVAAATLFLGVTQLRNMPVDTLPEFTQPYVEIQTEALGLSADEVEQLITVPLEADLLNGVAWLDTIRSESVPGLSSIVLVFEPGTDLFRARQLVAERLTQAHALPQVSKPPTMLQPLSSSSRVMMIGLSSKNLSAIEQSVLTRWTIRPRLMGVPGVANVAIWGQRERQLQVQVDPDKLRAHKVSLSEVIKTTGNALWVSPLTFLDASTPGTGGFIDTPNQRLGVRHVLPITTPADLAKVTIEKGRAGGRALRLGDVASVVEDHQPLIGDASVNNGAGLMLVVEKFPEANTLEVTRGVDAALESLRPGLSGMEIDSSVYRPASFIETAMGNLALPLLLGCALLLLLLVLVVFLFNWRTALISLVAILVSLAAAVLVLYLRGAALNAMVLAGLVLAVAIVVDDAIVGVEHVARRLRQHRQEDSDKSTAAVILEASLEVRGALLYATLIILLAIVPVLLLGGLSGAFFRPLALSYGLAVLASMVAALTVTPALSVLLLSGPPAGRRESPLVGRLQGRYGGVLARTVNRPRAVLAAAGVIVLLGLAVLPWAGRSQSLLPSFKERNLLIRWDGAPGTSGPEMTRVVAQASNELRSTPGVRNVGAHVGRAVMSDQVVGINSGELWVSIDPRANYDKTVASIQQVVDGYPGFQREVLTYLKDRTSGVLPVAGEAPAGADDAIVVRVYGQELEVLRSKAEEVRQALSEIDGVVDPTVEQPVEEPTLEVEVDLAKAERYGIKPGDVRRAATTLLSGIAVGSLFEEQKVFDVQVWSTPETRTSLTSVRELLIDTPGGGHVRLGDVAEVRVAAAPNVIRREAVSRLIDVSANVRGRDRGAVAGDVDRRIRQLSFPLEYHAELLGDYADRQAAQRRVVNYAAAAAIGIFLLLQAAFGSWRLAAVVFLTLPVALVGGVLAALAGGGIMSLGALAGFFTVLGIAVRNGVLLVSHYRRLERDEGETFGPELVVRGARERLAPVLTTVFATGLALVPLVVLDNPGHEIVHPMAVVVLGGLVTSALLNLFIVPALYLRFGARRPEPEPVSGPQVDLDMAKVNA